MITLFNYYGVSFHDSVLGGARVMVEVVGGGHLGTLLKEGGG